jgi:hypothetical protein
VAGGAGDLVACRSLLHKQRQTAQDHADCAGEHSRPVHEISFGENREGRQHNRDFKEHLAEMQPQRLFAGRFALFFELLGDLPNVFLVLLVVFDRLPVLGGQGLVSLVASAENLRIDLA